MSQEKEDYLREHLYYELEMLRYTHGRLKASLPRLLANALMESFVVHARNLMDFLYNQFDPTCFCAADFVPPDHSAGKKISFGTLGKVYGLVHEQTLHLGQRRPTKDLAKIAADERQKLRDAIEAQLPVFESAMLPDYKAIWEETKSIAAKAESAETIAAIGPANATASIFAVTWPSSSTDTKPAGK